MTFRMSIKNSIEPLRFYQKIFSLKIFPIGENKKKHSGKNLSGGDGTNFDRIDFLIKYKQFNTIFNAHSKYHVRFY